MRLPAIPSDMPSGVPSGVLSGARLPSIPSDANKYSRGSLLVLGGSTRFPGAAIMAALAAARAGAGYVTLAVPASVAPIAQAHLLSIPVIAAKEGTKESAASGAAAPSVLTGIFAPDALAGILAAVNQVNAIVCGPGLTSASDALAFAASVVRTVSVPVLVDADALRVIGTQVTSAAQSGLLADDGTAPLVLTPHAGELKRLLAATGAADVYELACDIDAVIVAKGPETLIVSRDSSVSSSSGTPALAKAGTGDVLSGIIGSLMAQGMRPFDAACAGVELHSAAGRLAEERLGTQSVMAEDLIDAIPMALQAFEQ